MFDELQRLHEDENLFQLLDHYVQSAADDKDAWLDRHAVLPEPARLHGLLVAFGWVEQNTGVVPAESPGLCRRCYRATNAGRRAWREHREGRDEASAAA